MNYVEEYIESLYQSINIYRPEQLKIQLISERLGLQVFYRNLNFRFNDIVIIKETTPQQEWQAFGHEVCHYLRHAGNQLMLPKLFVDLQEWQADYFAYHFCVPTFMLNNFKEVTISVIVNNFSVEYDFALRRFEMYQNKILIGGM